MNEWVMLGIGLLVGFLIGAITVTVIRKTKYAGTLVLYRETPKDPVQLLVELNDQPETLYGVSEVIFNVSSQK